MSLLYEGMRCNDLDASDTGKKDSEWTKMNTSSSLEASPSESRIASFASLASWAVNWFLLVVKAYVVVISNSKAVTAALTDSAVDLVSQAILSLAERYMGQHNPDYPVGRSRLEALSVLACASIMIMASVEVIQFSTQDIYAGMHGNKPTLNVDATFYIIMGIGVGLKFFLWIFCRWASYVLSSDGLDALAEDHFNDVISNTLAIITAAIAVHTPLWWFDPAGAIFISVVIILRWIGMMNEQVKKIVGHTAPPEFIEQVEVLAKGHDQRLAVDCTRAYHFGARYNVEMEIVLPGDMTVRESHDIALALQHKIESLSDVERAFVHVDHQERDGLEHKVERVLVKGAGALNPHAPVDSTTITPLTDDAVKTSADIEMVIVDGSRRG